MFAWTPFWDGFRWKSGRQTKSVCFTIWKSACWTAESADTAIRVAPDSDPRKWIDQSSIGHSLTVAVASRCLSKLPCRLFPRKIFGYADVVLVGVVNFSHEVSQHLHEPIMLLCHHPLISFTLFWHLYLVLFSSNSFFFQSFVLSVDSAHRCHQCKIYLPGLQLI